MAVVALAAPQEVAIAGTTPAYQGSLSISDTYTFPNDGRTFLHCKKVGAGACVATITTPRTIGGLAVADPTVTIPATTGDKMIGPFNPDNFQASDGLVTVAFSEITGLSVAVVRVP